MKLKRSDVDNIWRNINSVIYHIRMPGALYVFIDDTYDVVSRAISIQTPAPTFTPSNELGVAGFLCMNVGLRVIFNVFSLVWIQYALVRGIHTEFVVQRYDI